MCKRAGARSSTLLSSFPRARRVCRPSARASAPRYQSRLRGENETRTSNTDNNKERNNNSKQQQPVVIASRSKSIGSNNIRSSNNNSSSNNNGGGYAGVLFCFEFVCSARGLCEFC